MVKLRILPIIVTENFDILFKTGLGMLRFYILIEKNKIFNNHYEYCSSIDVSKQLFFGGPFLIKINLIFIIILISNDPTNFISNIHRLLYLV